MLALAADAQMMLQVVQRALLLNAEALADAAETHREREGSVCTSPSYQQSSPPYWRFVLLICTTNQSLLLSQASGKPNNKRCSQSQALIYGCFDSRRFWSLMHLILRVQMPMISRESSGPLQLGMGSSMTGSPMASPAGTPTYANSPNAGSFRNMNLSETGTPTRMSYTVRHVARGLSSSACSQLVQGCLTRTVRTGYLNMCCAKPCSTVGTLALCVCRPCVSISV